MKGEKGLFYKQHYLSPAFKFGEQVSALIPQNKRIKDVLEKSKPKRLSHLEQLERHKDSFDDRVRSKVNGPNEPKWKFRFWDRSVSQSVHFKPFWTV